MTAQPNITVVIVSWNVRGLLRDCLRSVQNETRLDTGSEVIVVDNASSDGSAEMVRAEFPWVRLVVNEVNEGFARANNRAFSLCDGKYLVLLNPDTVIVDRALDRLVDWMEAHSRAGIAGCRLLNTDGSMQRWTGGAFPNLCNLATNYFFLDRLLPSRLRPKPMFRVRDETADERVDWVSGACLIGRRETLGTRLFDDSYFMYGEDLELCERVATHGWEVWYMPSATVVHHAGRSMRKQSGPVTLSSVRGPRTFFARGKGPGSVLLYDLITTVGFLLRWLAFAIAATMPSRSRYRERACTNRQLMARAVQVMRGR